MKTRDFHYELPEELIAQHPAPARSGSRLLCLARRSGALRDRAFSDFVDLLHPDDILVFNNTRVIPARLFARKESGGRVEILIERLTGAYSALAHVRASKSPGPGTKLIIDADDDIRLIVDGRDGDLFVITSEAAPIADIVDGCGHMPLPPYIQRGDGADDFERYQTIYAAVPGAVAAPTAGLHFDENTMARIDAKGIDTAFVTLHVGAGTFQPVRTDTVESHTMHSEYLEVGPDVVEKCRLAREKGGRIIAIGTTAVRSLETAAAGGELEIFAGETDIFIYPGYEFRCIDALLTNFHLPESTLLMLVCAFAGFDNTLQAYRHAVEQDYRFFSYGDAMFIE